jgi:hypothetical protein
MSERDSFWQKFLFNYSSHTDNKVAHPIRALIDWAWLPDISNKVDAETARLVAQTLTWVLASTKNELRDQTTKALVNLQEQQPDVLIKTLQAFEKINDLYILERLYAVAYGCILRTEKDTSIKIIAQYIYNTIFKNGNPPVHILLRDYARNAVEYAIYKNVGLEINVHLIRPPYNSEMPVLPQSEDDVKMYKLDYDSSDFKQNYGFNYKIERIGKKYQWIALYEILAMLADNYKMKDSWGSDAKYLFYKGAWQNYLRNIDPAYITREKK